MKRVLITGANGFLGRRAVAYFKSKYEVFAPSHQEMDITDGVKVEAVFRDFMPDVVLHCAAVSDVGACEREPAHSHAINVEGSMYVAKASKYIGAKCVLCSSDQVYVGSKIAEAHSEEEVLTPANEYGRQKLLLEEKCLQINPDCVLLRLSWMYDKETKCATEHSDFMRTLIASLKEEEILCFPVYDIRGITDVNEVIANIEKTFEISSGVYNFGSPNRKSTYDMMYEVFKNLGWDGSKIEKNEEAFREHPRNISMTQTKLNEAGIYFSDTRERVEQILKEEGPVCYHRE